MVKGEAMSPGRPVAEKRWKGDRLLADLLADGERKVSEVLEAFRGAGLTPTDYRASRQRLGA